jgi:hypothetical protein
MANRRKGEVELEAGADVYTLRFSTNAICSLEDDLGMGINEIGGLLGDPANFRMSTFRTIVKACVVGNVTHEQAGDIIDAAGLEAVGAAIGKAFETAFPDAKPSAEGNEKATRGTGTRS